MRVDQMIEQADSGAERASEDRCSITEVGDVAAKVQAADAMLRRAAEVSAGRETSATVTASSMAVTKAKTLTAEASVSASSKLFELTVTHTTIGEYMLERHRRHACTAARRRVVSHVIACGSPVRHLPHHSKDSPMSGNISAVQCDSINHMLAERRMAAISAGTDDVHVLEIARQRRAEAMKEWLASSARGYRRGRAILTALAPLLCSLGLVVTFAVLLVAGGAAGRRGEQSPTVPGMHWSHYASSLFW
jgi:alkylation response protein AidB-like acyl-CoA dehydrogenase